MRLVFKKSDSGKQKHRCHKSPLKKPSFVVSSAGTFGITFDIPAGHNWSYGTSLSGWALFQV